MGSLVLDPEIQIFVHEKKKSKPFCSIFISEKDENCFRFGEKSMGSLVLDPEIQISVHQKKKINLFVQFSFQILMFFCSSKSNAPVGMQYTRWQMVGRASCGEGFSIRGNQGPPC